MVVAHRHVGAGDGIYHPEDELEVGGEVDVLVDGQHLIHPVGDHVHKVGVLHQPGGVEGEGQGRLVGLVVAAEVVHEEGVQVGLLLHVGAAAHQLAARQVLGVRCAH